MCFADDRFWILSHFFIIVWSSLDLTFVVGLYCGAPVLRMRGTESSDYDMIWYDMIWHKWICALAIRRKEETRHKAPEQDLPHGVRHLRPTQLKASRLHPQPSRLVLFRGPCFIPCNQAADRPPVGWLLDLLIPQKCNAKLTSLLLIYWMVYMSAVNLMSRIQVVTIWSDLTGPSPTNERDRK